MSPTPPRPLGSRYELLDLLGTGAMGEVWRARDRETGQERAAKVLRSEFARDTEIVTRFIQERSILMGLRHPNIVRVHDLVVEGDRLGILMDLVDGGDVRGRLRADGTMTGRDAVVVVGAVLDALAEAHSQGCLHRDVKPDNVLLDGALLADPGAVKLSDFSIAKLAQESTVMATGLLGTPGYMPPELFLHGQFSAASDVYAAGILLYELLGGRTPFAGPGTAHTVGHRHVMAEPPRLPVDDRLWHVLGTMLDKDPRVRLTAAGTARTLRDLPDAVLDRPRLPVQGHPETWATSGGTGERSEPIHVQERPAALDPGVTNLHAAPVASAPLAGTGQVRAWGPADAPDEGVTSVGRAAPEHQAPVLTPGAAVDATPVRRPWLVWLTVAVVLLGLISGGVAFAQSRDGGAAAPPEAPGKGAVATTAVQADDARPSGLTVTREVAFDPASRTLRLTVRYATQKAALTGPFLEVVPAADDTQQCPAVDWQGAPQPSNIGRTTGILTACAYAIQAPTIPAQSSWEVTAVVDLDLGDDPEAVSTWLERAAGLTAEALGGASVQPSAYPVQRLADVRVDVPAGVTVRTRNLRVVLRPVWVSGPDDSITLLYDSSTGQSSGLLDQVAGGLEGVSLDESCGGALSISRQRAVSVLRPTEDCRIGADVGNFDVESSPFTISSLGG
ncbi:serine/threonine-protein kinase [Nocardioides donggukensis]|uniref:non-specific serine/threonine protein kinase n=1 Tax=Nocardioides donggukensis TaxID=2774019 RepID=A0A927PZN5_9ACTN|nr:serine/threonine-protein kinase [Nocardioides donggukensis]MBD8870508.1 serine/threonine protein kinase [Nocardioides donggukensis]